jgi:hypothetical protein
MVGTLRFAHPTLYARYTRWKIESQDGALAELRRRTGWPFRAGARRAGMRNPVGAGALCAAALAACSTAPPPSAAPQPLPAVKQTIAASKLFTDNANARNVTISGVRRFSTVLGYELGACVRASTISMTGKPMGTVTYVVIVDRNQVIERRTATPEDECTRENYEPLAAP